MYGGMTGLKKDNREVGAHYIADSNCYCVAESWPASQTLGCPPRSLGAYQMTTRRLEG
jgi:hypothetical protein